LAKSLAKSATTSQRSTSDRYIETVSHVIEGLADVGDFREMGHRLARALVEHFAASRSEIWMRYGPDGTLERQAAQTVEGEPAEADPAVANWLN